MVREGVVGLPAEEVDRVVADVEEAEGVVLGRSVGVAEDEGDVDLAVTQQLERLDRVPVEQAQLDPGVRRGQRGGRLGHDRAQRRRVGRQPHPPGLQADLGGELGGRRVDPAHDLGGPVGQQPPLRRQPDATTDPLDELGAGGGLQAGQVVAHRRLRVVQLAGRLGHRPVPGDGGQDA